MSLHKSSGVLILLAVLATQAAILIAINLLFPGTVGDPMMLTSRWLGLVAVVGYCLKRASLTTWIFGSMLIGTAIGTDFPEVATNLKVVSQLFLKLIKTVIDPLIFGTLVVGIAGHSNLKQVGRMGWKSLLYFEIVTTLALLICLLAINISQAGAGIELPVGEVPLQGTARTWQEVILHIFPENIAKSVGEGEILQIVIFSILFGIGLVLVKDGKKKQVMLYFTESLSEVMFNFTRIIMYFAPFGVGAAIAYTVGEMGLGILVNLFHLLATLHVALLAFLVLVLMPIALLLKIPVIKFLKAISEPVSIDFGTTSSEAALPKAMEALDMVRTSVNVIGTCLATSVIAKWEGEFGLPIVENPDLILQGAEFTTEMPHATKN
ncbi:proton glutamate symport protein [Algoriphagus alkaliphilus]|uniref:Proton glutamate symport protein n=1 Tax=Algoriphagus alkaliphilus TaxID=279824 RepID=A0A1G5XFF2_9BACT|nr:cation:dicarboxylase symporter family transporter [Algoriphagus alkaliphilus]SDA69178.1 proton glutamate symport protein [Algoriphagus alkaliphilus]